MHILVKTAGVIICLSSIKWENGQGWCSAVDESHTILSLKEGRYYSWRIRSPVVDHLSMSHHQLITPQRPFDYCDSCHLQNVLIKSTGSQVLIAIQHPPLALLGFYSLETRRKRTGPMLWCVSVLGLIAHWTEGERFPSFSLTSSFHQLKHHYPPPQVCKSRQPAESSLQEVSY